VIVDVLVPSAGSDVGLAVIVVVAPEPPPAPIVNGALVALANPTAVATSV
jgi:hypothetical protein